MTEKIIAKSYRRGEATLTQSASSIVTVKYDSGEVVRLLSDGRRLCLATLDGFLMAAYRDRHGLSSRLKVFSPEVKNYELLEAL